MAVQAPRLVRNSLHQPRSRVFDAACWQGYQPRPDDIIIGTYSKCGTTWTQHLVGMLVFQSAQPRPIMELSLWPDFRFLPPEVDVWQLAEAQMHRRFFKTHLPFDAIPLYEDVKYIHVARDGRDAALSLHNHLANFTPAALAIADRVSLNDPKFGDPFPRVTQDAGAYFHQWLTEDQAGNEDDLSFFYVERSYWAERKRDNVLLVHYADLKADLAGEVRRIADFLDIEIGAELLSQIVEAGGFAAMKRNGDAIMPMAQMMWDGGADRFLHKGTNGRWRDLFAAADIEAYSARVAAEFTPSLARWVEGGRLAAGDPEATD